jgi:ankyrin repeat protein
MITKKEILIKYDLKEHSFKHITKKHKIKPIHSDGYKNYYEESDLIDCIKKYTIKKKWDENEIEILKKCYPNGGFIECEKILNRKNIDINQKDKKSKTALMDTKEKGNKDIINYLISKEAK